MPEQTQRLLQRGPQGQPAGKANTQEFFAYRIIYLVLQDSELDLQRFIRTLAPADLAHEFIQIALK